MTYYLNNAIVEALECPARPNPPRPLPHVWTPNVTIVLDGKRVKVEVCRFCGGRKPLDDETPASDH